MSDHILVCHHCYTVNSIQQSRFENQPMCRDCDTALLPAIPVEVDEQALQCFITHSTLPIVVDFWAPWSGICHQMSEPLILLANTFKQDALFLRINSEQQQVLANKNKIMDIPTFILFTGGQEYHRLHGAISEYEFHRWLERYLRIKRKKAFSHPPSV